MATPEAVRASSAAAALSIDATLVDIGPNRRAGGGAAELDEALTASQAAVPLGVSRPPLVAGLEAGRIPYDQVACADHTGSYGILVDWRAERKKFTKGSAWITNR